MAQSVSLILLLLGALFMFLASIGLVRMPDVLMRMHSTTKSNTLGVGLIMLGVALRFDDFAIAVRSLAIVIFLFSTAPVAAHMIGRAAYLSGVPLWDGTLSDEMRGRYDLETHTLSSRGKDIASAQEAGSD
ncbi:MAG: monovalent cation/H(+) antiporter subunit G [Anaerolineales bacterium]|nr:monovalent cation/H(+) antiporter subunit G [Anaerolineales bacterium]NUQ85926.1 monovalent cation/H(+) antiporter subunit G [Anaerolineales bacterium]